MKREAKKSKIGLLAELILCLILVPVIVINTVMIVKTYTNPEHIPGIFGVKPMIVLSGSMSPTFEADSLVFIKETDVSELKKGDVICYLTGGAAVTHRIEQISQDGGETRFVTKGDANNTADRLAVAPNQVEGRYIGHIGGLGGVALFMQTTTGMILFIVLPVLLYLAWDFSYRSREARADKRRADELEAELAALKAEKEKNNT